MNEINDNLIVLKKDGSIIIFDNQDDYRKNHNKLLTSEIVCIMKTGDLIYHYIEGNDAVEKLKKLKNLVDNI